MGLCSTKSHLKIQ